MITENKPQQQAIEKTQGPTIILAGAGTGKSYTLKKKAKHLINEQQLYKPEEELPNKEEIREHLKTYCGLDTEGMVWILQGLKRALETKRSR